MIKGIQKKKHEIKLPNQEQIGGLHLLQGLWDIGKHQIDDQHLKHQDLPGHLASNLS